nr:MAG TPA: hypothetical protein [Caudoviricetes sp.]
MIQAQSEYRFVKHFMTSKIIECFLFALNCINMQIMF